MNERVTAYKIANHFDAFRNGLPDEYQDWAAEISRDLRWLAAAEASAQAEIPGKPVEKWSDNIVGTNAGHGHVWPRPDGQTMRCGGPTMCRVCRFDQLRVNNAGAAAVDEDAVTCGAIALYSIGNNATPFHMTLPAIQETMKLMARVVLTGAAITRDR